LSPDGKKIVFDSNRNRTEEEPLNTSDLFLMNTDGSEQTLLTRGSSATWSPDSKNIAFHASASGHGLPIRPDPGSATSDSDIFVANVDDLLAGLEQRMNITNSQSVIDEDPDWSPDGQQIVYTRHPDSDDPRFSNTAEIYVLNTDGTGTPQRLTYNIEEERGPAWSPDGTRIMFSCRTGGGTADFEHDARGRHRPGAADRQCRPRLDRYLVTGWPADRVPPGSAHPGAPAVHDECGRQRGAAADLSSGDQLAGELG